MIIEYLVSQSVCLQYIKIVMQNKIIFYINIIKKYIYIYIYYNHNNDLMKVYAHTYGHTHCTQI